MAADLRLREGVGDALFNAALIGFENYLSNDQQHPSLDDVVNNRLRGRLDFRIFILIAALAERLRNHRSFEDLKDEPLLAAFFIYLNTTITYQRHALNC